MTMNAEDSAGRGIGEPTRQEQRKEAVYAVKAEYAGCGEVYHLTFYAYSLILTVCGGMLYCTPILAFPHQGGRDFSFIYLSTSPSTMSIEPNMMMRSLIFHPSSISRRGVIFIKDGARTWQRYGEIPPSLTK